MGWFDLHSPDPPEASTAVDDAGVGFSHGVEILHLSPTISIYGSIFKRTELWIISWIIGDIEAGCFDEFWLPSCLDLNL